MSAPILIFDGHCNLCNGLVRFVLERERTPTIQFAAATSITGQELARASGNPDAPHLTFLWFEDGVFLDRSDAALALLAHLRRPWRWLSHLTWIPKVLRDTLYNLIARNRYRWFGRRDECLVPLASTAARFLD
ncbi:MAG: DCC1-like thiol-disulfide oxidoreductase family protein [Pseudomonadota bacterium]